VDELKKRRKADRLSEKIMTWALWPVSLLAYCMVVLGALNVVMWLWSILSARLCSSCSPCVMR
jgi:hypothetical protein